MPTTPPPIGANSPQGPEKPEPNKPLPHKKFEPKPLTFLGMHFDAKETAKLWQIISQSVGREIERNKAKMIKALREFREEQDQG